MPADMPPEPRIPVLRRARAWWSSPVPGLAERLERMATNADAIAEIATSEPMPQGCPVNAYYRGVALGLVIAAMKIRKLDR